MKIMSTNFRLRFAVSTDAYSYFSAAKAAQGWANPKNHGGMFPDDPGWADAPYEVVLVRLSEAPEPLQWNAKRTCGCPHCTEFFRTNPDA